MNFLAHLHLSGNHDNIRIGNFIGDFVKGNELDQFESEIQIGIKLHQAIDAYTDSHEIVSLSKDRIREKYRHYSGVIMDIFYDHFLALNWQKFHPSPLRAYVNDQYELLQLKSKLLPYKTQQMLPYMISNDWLFNYQFFEGIEKVMHGMSRRSKFNSKMEQSVVELRVHHHALEKDFLEFYPQLIDFSKTYLEDLIKNA